MMRKQQVQLFLSAYKHLLSATLDMYGMQENVRQSNLQLVCRLFHLKGLCHFILGYSGKIFSCTFMSIHASLSFCSISFIFSTVVSGYCNVSFYFLGILGKKRKQSNLLSV